MMNATEHTFASWDGARLAYRAWLPARPASRAVLLFHRGHEHSGRWQETVQRLALEDTAIFAWDARGHGHSPGERGTAENIVALIKDADAWARHLTAAHGIAIEDMAVVAHSVGAVVATAWVHDFAPRIRALVLAAPAFRVKLYLPFAVPLLRLRQRLVGPGFVRSYVRSSMLTHDPIQAAAYDADPLIFRQIAVNVLLDLFDTSTRLLADASAITTPTLMLTAGADWVVKQAAQRTFFERLGSPVKELAAIPHMRHAMFHDSGRAQLVDRIRAFVLASFALPVDRTALLSADARGHTKDEFERLQRPGSPVFALTRASMKTVGRLSTGIALGWRRGFDSGTTLDYIYENNAGGVTLLGRLMDRAYLDAIGWRGIRARRENLERLLRSTIEQTHAAGQPVHILDIATGAGRYVLETLHALPHIPATAHLRDYKEENLDAARRTAEQLRVRGVAFDRADAFDPASYENLTTRPTIGIVSGLHELIPDNARVLRSLHGLARSIPRGGHLLYTGQPWHPQVEFIARVLRNREGQPWIMRRRTQAEMDELVRSAGFEKIDMDIDPWGIFTVSVARRV